MTQDPHPVAVHNEASPGISSHCPENVSRVDIGPGSSLHGPHAAHTFSGPSLSGTAHIKLIPKVQSESTRKPVCVLMLGADDLSPNKYLCVRTLESPQHTKPRREPVLAGLRSNHKMWFEVILQRV